MPLNNILPLAVELKQEERRDDSYFEVTRRIKDVDFEQEFRKIHDIESKMQRLLDILQTPNWYKDPLFDLDELPFIALYALKQKKLTPYHFADLCLLHAKKLEVPGPLLEDLKVIPLIDKEGKVNQVALSIIITQLNQSQKRVSASKVKAILKKIGEDPGEVKQYLFLIPNQLKENNAPLISKRLYDISYRIGTYVSNFLFLDNNQKFDFFAYRQIPSFTLTTALQSLLYEHPILPSPVLGSSSVKDILSSQENGCRDVAIPFPKVSLPKQADGLDAPGYDFTYHDLYHVDLASNVNDGNGKMVSAFIKAAKFFRKFAKDLKCPLSKKFTYSYAWKIVDMEHGYFLPEIKKYFFKLTQLKNESNLFWHTLFNSIEVKLLENNMNNTQGIWRDRDRIIEIGFFRMFIEHINQNSKEWKEEYDIDIQSARDLINTYPKETKEWYMYFFYDL